MISSGRPWRAKISFTKRSAVSFEVIEDEQGKNSAILVYLSTTTIMESKPQQEGKPLIKSTDTEDQGEVACCKGCRRPWGFSREGLVKAQIAQPRRNFLTWGQIPFHENSRVIRLISLVRPMWPARGWLCLASITSCWSSLAGTQNFQR